MNTIKSIIVIFVIYCISDLNAQDQGHLSGTIETNANVFIKDESINAFNNPQYDNQFFGGETWASLRYNVGTLRAGMRYDMFLNSNLPNPNDSYTDNGIGMWFIKKRFDKIEFEVGNLYDQIGSGIIYRAYEQRPLFIDNSLQGLSIKYQINPDWEIKTFVGRQKNAFDLYDGSIKGISTDAFFSFGEENPISIAPGIGFINKTLSSDAIEKVVNSLKSYLPEDRFGPAYNSFAVTFYNTLSSSGFTMYSELALKSKDIFFNPLAQKQELIGAPTFGKLEYETGRVFYTSLSYAKNKLGVTLEAKRTENFSFRIDPNLRLLRGFISYIPPMNRQNTYRLPARYSPATQEISEQAIQLDINYRVNKKLSFLLNGSNISDLDNNLLYRELFFETTYKKSSKIKLNGGIQVVNYNQAVYEQKPEVPIVKTFVPFADILYKFTRKKSIRFETQLMSTKQDFGSWYFGLVEIGLAPHWLFELSAMYNFSPKRKLIGSNEFKKILYPTAGVVYLEGPNRFQLRFVKQVEGVVCSGGICRLEPAFSGFRFSASTQF